MVAVKILNVVACDDIRQEKSEKHILVGAFGGPLFVAPIPNIIPVALWLHVKPDGPGGFEASIRARAPNGDVIINGSFSSQFSTADSSSIALQAVPLQIRTPGLYRFEWSSDKKRWKEMIAIDVRVPGT